MVIILKKKKINVVSEFWPPHFVGGGEISTYIISKELVKRGYEITVLTPNVPNTNDEKFIFLRLKNPPIFLEPIEKIYFKKISSEDKLPDGVYWASDFYGAAFLSDKKVKKIVTVRDYWSTCPYAGAMSEDFGFCSGCKIHSLLKCSNLVETKLHIKIPRTLKYLYNKNFRRKVLQRFNYTVFTSNFLKNKISREIKFENYSVINNPISQSFVKTPVPKNKVHNNVLYVGAVIRHKGTQVLISAMKKILIKNPKINLTMVGRVYDDPKIFSEKLKVSNNIKLIGQIPNDRLIDYYDSSDIIVNSSLWSEPFGRTIIEGMARGCIPIGPDNTGCAEIIKGGKVGYLFSKGDFNHLAEVIVRLYNNKEEIMKTRSKGREYALDNFSPEKIADQYEEIFRKYL